MLLHHSNAERHSHLLTCCPSVCLFGRFDGTIPPEYFTDMRRRTRFRLLIAYQSIRRWSHLIWVVLLTLYGKVVADNNRLTLRHVSLTVGTLS